jgi:hypothetical protein
MALSRTFLMLMVFALQTAVAQESASDNCSGADTHPVCVAKTWVNCYAGPAGSFCETIGLARITQRPPLSDDQYTSLGHEARKAGEIARHSPWRLALGDFGYLTGIEWEIVGTQIVNEKRSVGVSAELLKTLLGTTEVMLSATSDLLAYNYSVFVRSEDSGWRFVAWHGASAPFGGGFNSSYDLTEMREECSGGEGQCANFAYGLQPWEALQPPRPAKP